MRAAEFEVFGHRAQLEGQIPSDYWIFKTNPSPTRVRGLSGAGAPSATARPGGLRGLAERCVNLFYTTIKKMVIEHVSVIMRLAVTNSALGENSCRLK